jgi:RHS repeat-associated protein
MVACAETLTAESEGKELRARRALGVENSGYRYDAETDNYYVRNRYYSPTLGRWLTRDPIGYQGGINLYGYVESEPAFCTDSHGLIGSFVPGMGTFWLKISGAPSAGANATNWAEARVHSRFYPSRSLLNRHQCLCTRIRLVRFVKATYVTGGSERSRGFHLDDAGNPSLFTPRPPFVGSDWDVGGVGTRGLFGQYASAGDDTGPIKGQLHAYSYMSLRFKLYAVCVRGKLAGRSFGYLDYTIRWFLGLSSVVQWQANASVRNSGAHPFIAVIVSGTLAEPKYGTLGPLQHIQPLPGWANVPVWSTQG